MMLHDLIETAFPVVLGAVLAVATGFFSDWRKTHRDDRKALRDRQERELRQINAVSTAMGFNIESLLHIVMQQILPHREHSHAALEALDITGGDEEKVRVFFETMHDKYRAMMMRCPEPYFIDLEFFKEISFVLAKDPELLKRSGWMVSYTRALKELIKEQNIRIDLAANRAEQGLTFTTLREDVRVQAHIGDGEVINALMLFEQFVIICKKLRKITETYSKEFGVRLAVAFPEPLESVMGELRRIAVTVVPDAPPPDPEASPTTR
jgi:hypothetical protein